MKGQIKYDQRIPKSDTFKQIPGVEIGFIKWDLEISFQSFAQKLKSTDDGICQKMTNILANVTRSRETNTS